MHLAGQEDGCPNVSYCIARNKMLAPFNSEKSPRPAFRPRADFGNCIGMRRHLAAPETINPEFARHLHPMWTPALHLRVGLDSRVHGHLRNVIPMIRVTKTEERSRTVVTIDGQLSGECVTVVETFCSQAASRRKPIYVFLRDVTTVDQAGTMLLRRLAARGIRLLARGIYTSYLVHALAARHAPAQVPSAGTEHLASDARRRTL
jgi:hypothetical protein